MGLATSKSALLGLGLFAVVRFWTADEVIAERWSRALEWLVATSDLPGVDQEEEDRADQDDLPCSRTTR